MTGPREIYRIREKRPEYGPSGSKRKKNKWRRPRNLLQMYEENLDLVVSWKPIESFSQRASSTR